MSDSEYQVGGEVTIRATIRQVDNGTDEPIRIDHGGWILAKDIVSYTPAPKPFRHGDPVIADGTEHYEFIELRDDLAILWSPARRVAQQYHITRIKHKG